MSLKRLVDSFRGGGKGEKLVKKVESNLSEEPVYHELAKGVVEESHYSKVLGKPLRHQNRRIKMAKYQEYYQTVDIVGRAIDTYVDVAMSPGFQLVEIETGRTDTKPVEVCRQLMDRINGEEVIRRLLTEVLIFGTTFLELDIEKGKIKRILFLHPKDMRVHIDEHGNIVKITQRKRDEKGQQPEWTGDDLDNIKMVAWNVVGEDVYGLGLVERVADLVQKKIDIEKDLKKITHLFAHPWVLVKVGTDKYPASEATVDEVSNEIEEYKPGDYLVTRHNVEIKIETPEIPSGLQEYYDRIVNNIIIGLGVPKSLLGAESRERSPLQGRLVFDRRVKSLQKLASRVFEEWIFPRELELAKIGRKQLVALKWNPLVDPLDLSGRELCELVANQIITAEEARRYLEGRGVPISGKKEEVL